MKFCEECLKFYEKKNCPFCSKPAVTTSPVQEKAKSATATTASQPKKEDYKAGCVVLLVLVAIIVVAIVFFFNRCSRDEYDSLAPENNVEVEEELIEHEPVGIEEIEEYFPEIVDIEPAPEPVDPVIIDYVLLWNEFGFLDESKWVTITGTLRGGGAFINYGFSDDIDGTIRFTLADESMWENFTDGDIVTVTGFVASHALGVMFIEYCIMTHATEYEIERMNAFALEREIATAAATFQERIIVERDGITVTLTDFSSGGIFASPSLSLFIENNSDTSIAMQVREIAVNGFTVTTIFHTEIGAGRMTNDEIIIPYSELNINNIETISTIELSFIAFESENIFVDIFETEMIVIDVSPYIHN